MDEKIDWKKVCYELALQGRSMRQKQNKYFKTHDKSVQVESMQLESAFDAKCDSIIRECETPSLF